MSKKEQTKIAIIGKFTHLYDEEYIARSFEMIGCEVKRIPQHSQWRDIQQALITFRPDVLLFAKWEKPPELLATVQNLQRNGMKTVCWLFDLYFDYTREYQIRNKSFFKADYVFTTDGGHNHRWPSLGIKHQCLRQGIYKEQCVLLPFEEIQHEIVFVGSESPVYPERSRLVLALKAEWFGRKDTNQLRDMALNELYASTRIVIGDSYPSPHYWSNRVVETLGRGGFLIHKEVEGLKEEYPDLVTYTDLDDLKKKIAYYKEHEYERREIIKKNFELVRSKYTMDKKCQDLLDYVKANR